MAEEQKKPGVRGKDRKPRRTEGYQKSSPKNLREQSYHAGSEGGNARRVQCPLGFVYDGDYPD